MPRTSFRIACCLCGKSIPKSQDIYALDAEWQRRFPKMTGTLACGRCALHDHPWQCEKPGGGFVGGHIPATHDSSDIDAWSHVGLSGTHVAMVLEHPESGLLQGAEEYLRYVARRSGVNGQVAQRLRVVLEGWDARAARATAADPGVPSRSVGC
jgi:hypothetical protein